MPFLTKFIYGFSCQGVYEKDDKQHAGSEYRRKGFATNMQLSAMTNFLPYV